MIPNQKAKSMPPKLFDGAEADALGLAECAVDSAGFGNSHFGPGASCVVGATARRTIVELILTV